jgi:hypothetical protein
MNSDKQSSGPSAGVLVPGLFVLAFAILSALHYSPPLQSSRKDPSRSESTPPPPVIPGMHSFYSHLSDDPLASSYEDHHKQEEDWFAQLKQILNKAGAAPAGTHKASDAYKKTFTRVAQNPKGVLCLPVMVSGDPYSDDREDRIRTTYAVLAALANSGFELSFATRLTYVEVPIKVWLDTIQQKAESKTLIVPLKLLRRPNGQTAPAATALQENDVVAMWIDESQMGSRPLYVIEQVITALFEPSGKKPGDNQDWKKKIAVRIVGPNSSDSLYDLDEEMNHFPQGKESKDPHAPKPPLGDFRDVQIFCGRATIPDAARHLPPWPPIIRTVGDDSQLAAALIRELGLRGGWPGAGTPAEKNTVVLLSERDTLYGKTFQTTFEGQAKDVTVRRITYLRGIDGELPGETPGKRRSDHPSSEADSLDVAPTRPADLPPTGRSQFDYVRRLQQDLLQLHANERAKGNNGIVAVGIVATDVYDKLLILRALRPSFPRAHFFTTDVNAEYSDEAERKTARNLIIASHFGLQLKDQLQQDIPPFRDSYQTATYFSALMALKNDNLEAILAKNPALHDNPWGYGLRDSNRKALEPLIYELGIRGPYQLTMPGLSAGSDPINQQVQPESPRQNSWLQGTRWFSIFVALFCAWLCLFNVYPPFRRYVAHNSTPFGWVVCSYLAIGALSIVVGVLLPLWIANANQAEPDGEPFALWDGLSLWPSIYTQLIATCFAGYYIYKMCSDLEVSGKRFIDDWVSGHKRESMDWHAAYLFNWFKLKRAKTAAETAASVKPSAREAFKDYWARGAGRLRLFRSGLLAIAYAIIGWCVFEMTDFPTNPYRGTWSHVLSVGIALLAVFATLALAFMVVDATQLCRRLAKALRRAHPDWSDTDDVKKALKNRGNLNEQEQDDVRHLVTIQAIALRSEVACKAVVYPFVVIFLLALSRNPTFAYLNLGLPLLALGTLLLGAIVLSSLSARWASSETRDQILTRLRARKSAVLDPTADKRVVMRIDVPGEESVVTSGNEPVRPAPRRERLDLVIDEIENEQRGALGPWYSDPVLHGLVIALGGTTGIILIQQFVPWLIL